MRMENRGSGMGFYGLLTIVFITLKLIGIIDWSWIWVLSPIWISISISLIVIAVAWVYVRIKHANYFK